MVSWSKCIWMIMTIICGQTMKTSEAITCHISGQERRVNWNTIITNNNSSCNSTQNKLSMTGKNGTLEYNYQDRNGSLILILDKINNSSDYKKIHQLECQHGTLELKGKLRFGKNINISFKKVLEYFQNYSVTQWCQCLFWDCNNESCLTFFCNCIFSISSRENAVLLTTTTITASSSWSQTTTAAGTDTTADSLTTHIPTMSESTTRVDDSTSTRTDYISADRQSDGDNAPTLAVAGGSIALLVIVSGVTVFVCLRRKRWHKSQTDYSEPIVTNPSYGVLKENDSTSGHEAGLEQNRNSEHTYDLADDQKLKTTGEQDYSYANFGGQRQFKDQVSTPTIPGITTGNVKGLTASDVSSGNNNYDFAKELSNGDATGIQGDNYFLLQKESTSEENNQENGAYTLAQSHLQTDNGVYTLAQSQSQTENGFGNNRKNEQKQRKADVDVDPYDHVRVGHVKTNGMDDGVYDELRKQNVRYESEEVDNDYDRCPATENL